MHKGGNLKKTETIAICQNHLFNYTTTTSNYNNNNYYYYESNNYSFNFYRDLQIYLNVYTYITKINENLFACKKKKNKLLKIYHKTIYSIYHRTTISLYATVLMDLHYYMLDWG